VTTSSGDKIYSKYSTVERTLTGFVNSTEFSAWGLYINNYGKTPFTDVEELVMS
jgi:hypothetical protein